MAISESGWFSWAIIDEGPKDRQQYWGGLRSSMEVIVHHSLEGYYKPGGYVAFRDPTRWPTLWHGTIKYDGRFYQHAPVFLRTVHGHSANVLGPGFESEGFYNEPLTSSQVATWRLIHKDIAEFTQREFRRVKGSRRGLVEHREMGPTGCPSERYAPLWKMYEEEGMASQEYETIMKLLYGENYEERIQELEDIGVLPLEARVSRFESNDGPIGKRLTQLEMDSISHEAGLKTLEIRHGIHVGDDE